MKLSQQMDAMMSMMYSLINRAIFERVIPEIQNDIRARYPQGIGTLSLVRHRITRKTKMKQLG